MFGALSGATARHAKIVAYDDAGDGEHLDAKIAGPFRTSRLDGEARDGPPDLAGLLQDVASATREPECFYAVPPAAPEATWRPCSLTLASTNPKNPADIVSADIVGRLDGRSAVILIPHWNAGADSYGTLVKLLARFGFTIFVVTLPFHRDRGCGPVANGFLNADLGATIAAVRQAVVEVRMLTREVGAHGFRSIAYLGISLGSCIAALAAAFEPDVDRAALLLTAGDFAETVWTGTATRHIRSALEGHVTLDELRQAWSIISPASFFERIAARDLPTLVVIGRLDGVVRYRLGESFVAGLSPRLRNLSVARLGCGHYSLAMFPYNIVAFALVSRFLLRRHAIRRSDGWEASLGVTRRWASRG